MAFLFMFSSGSVAAERNCDDFTRQSDAQQHFSSNGGSTTSNTDGLDGDRDGVACEALSQGVARRLLHTIVIHPFLTIAALIPEIAAGVWLVHVVRRFRPPEPTTQAIAQPEFRSPVSVPAASEVPASGLLSVTVLDLPTNLPAGLIVEARMPNASPVSVPVEPDGTSTLALPVGIWTVQVMANGNPVSQPATTGIVTDDVTRLDLTYDPAPAAQPPIA